MPTVSTTDAGPPSIVWWGVYPVVSRVAAATTDRARLQAALSIRIAEYHAMAARVTYSDAGRSEQHDAHRKSLLDEIEQLQRLIGSAGANGGEPWLVCTPY